jgi:hypothetical protein
MSSDRQMTNRTTADLSWADSAGTEGRVAGCVLEVSVQSRYYLVRFETDNHRGLDRILDLLMTEPITYNPVFYVWPSVSPRPEFADNQIRADFDVTAGVGAVHYTTDRGASTGSWLGRSVQPVSGLELSWDYHNGIQTRFPDTSIIPLNLWRQVLHEYLHLCGARPACVDWQPTEFAW